MPASPPGRIDELARRMAQQAGVRWDDLSDHPGYLKLIWREKARETLTALGVALAPEPPPATDRAPRFFAS